MQAFERYAQQHRLSRLWFHAQLSAVPFYLALDYEIVSDEFHEAGIPHVVMHKHIQ
jgi:predicted GNAT family N-acyltransferase